MLNNINTILSLSFKDREENKYNTNDILFQYIDDDNVFVSFTEINKLGINPNSKYDTPLGIYAYPVKLAYKYYIKGDKNFVENLPFANQNDFFTIFKAKDFNKIISNTTYDNNKLEEDFVKHYEIGRASCRERV